MADEQMISVRNLIDSDIGPLRKFTGILDSTPTEKKSYGEGEKTRQSLQVSLNFKDLEVIEAIEPFHFPIFIVYLNLSNRKKSKYGIFGQSLNAILDKQYSKEQLDPTNPAYIKPDKRMDLKDCIGKRIGMVMADGEAGRPAPPMLFDGRVQVDKATPCWSVYMVEGIGEVGESSASPLQKAVGLLDGRTLTDFNKAAMEDTAIRGDTQLLMAISMPPSAQNNFANTMITSQQFTKDANGVYHKVVSQVPRA